MRNTSNNVTARPGATKVADTEGRAVINPVLDRQAATQGGPIHSNLPLDGGELGVKTGAGMITLVVVGIVGWYLFKK